VLKQSITSISQLVWKFLENKVKLQVFFFCIDAKCDAVISSWARIGLWGGSCNTSLCLLLFSIHSLPSSLHYSSSSAAAKP